MEEQKIIQRYLSPYIVAEAFNTITSDDILNEKNGKWSHKGNPLTEGQIKILKQEAKKFQESKIYDIIFDEIQFHAKEKERMSRTENDLIASRSLSYLADILDSKVKKLANL